MKRFTVTIDDTTFVGGRPAALNTIRPTETLSLIEILIHTAIWTTLPHFRTPTYCIWAVLRYCHLFQSGGYLRLVREWDDADSHQKSCLSEDVAIGVAGSLFMVHGVTAEQTFLTYAVRTHIPIPTASGGRTIPAGLRTADYISTLYDGSNGILECKGTQHGLSVLEKKVTRGEPQKQGARLLFGPVFALSIVSGLKIPTARSRQDATILIRDPPPPEDVLGLLGISSDELRRRILCGSIASQLRVAGMPTTADAIATRKDEAIPAVAKLEVNRALQEREILRLPVDDAPSGEINDIVVRASIRPKLAEALLANKPISALEAMKPAGWEHEAQASSASVTTARGVSVSVVVPPTVSPAISERR